MILEEFIRKLSIDVINFHINMRRMGISSAQWTGEEWMNMFLAWSEWKTDMHDEYWRNDGEEKS